MRRTTPPHNETARVDRGQASASPRNPVSPYSCRLNSTALDAGETFLRAEQAGLKLAIIGRIGALVLMGVWLIGTRADDPARALGYVLVLSIFAALGLAHYPLIGTRFDKRWVKYVFITLDIAIVSALVATQPLYPSAADLPPVMTFRAPVFPFYFVILGVAAFSFSPAMVMWTGIAGAIGWLSAFWHTASMVSGVRNWSEIPNNPTAEQIMAIVLDPRFGGLSARRCRRGWRGRVPLPVAA